MKKIFSLILTIIIISYGVSLIQVSGGKQKLPTILGFTGVTIISGSMEPELSVGDYVIIKKAKKGNIEKGDIITFEQNGVLVTHRVEKVIGEGVYSTKGDANNTVDSEFVKFEDILGINTLVVHKFGQILLFIRVIPGLISILFTILLFILWPKNIKAKKSFSNK